MAKTRLLVRAKERLRNFARDNVSTPKEQRAVDRAYAKVARILTPIIEKKYPPATMEILEQCKVARRDRCVRCINENGRVIEFSFKEEDAPLVPNRYCSSRNFKVTKACLDALDDYDLRKGEKKKAEDETLSKYFGLIEASRYAEDIIEVWPAAAPMLSEYFASQRQNLPAAVSADVIAFIRKDNAGEQLEAA